MKAHEKRPDGVYIGGRRAYTAPDGYVRRLDVQTIAEAPDYRKKLVKKSIGAVVGLLIAGLLLWMIIDKLL